MDAYHFNSSDFEEHLIVDNPLRIKHYQNTQQALSSGSPNQTNPCIFRNSNVNVYRKEIILVDGIRIQQSNMQQPQHQEMDEMDLVGRSSGGSDSEPEIPTMVCGIYHVAKKLGSGSFGELYLGIHTATGEQVAMKFERVIGPRRHSTLHTENEVLLTLQGGPGVPVWKFFGREGNYHVLVMQLLGMTLEDYRRRMPRGCFSHKTVLMLGDQLLSRLELLHSHNYIHRDLKPENMLVGAEPFSVTIFLIDFGLSKRYRHKTTLEHIPERDGKTIVGTARYASLRCHYGKETSRRDDLESLAYVLIYLSVGKLPWQGTRAVNRKQHEEKRKELKLCTPLQVLCTGVPEVLQQFLIYSRNLDFSAAPDYPYLHQLFRHSLCRSGHSIDWVFDWMLPTSSTAPVPSNMAVEVTMPQIHITAKRTLQQLPTNQQLIYPHQHIILNQNQSCLNELKFMYSHNMKTLDYIQQQHS